MSIEIVFPAVTEGPIGGATVQSVNARDLHRSMRVGRDFSSWIKDRIERYGFAEHQDYEIYEDLSSPNPVSSKARAQTTKEYALTIDMAKEIAMVENSDEGRVVRRHFIECERRAKHGITAQDLLSNPRQLLAIAQGYALQIEDMKRDMAVMQTDVDALDRIARAEGLFGIRQAAQILQMPERKFVQWTMQQRWTYRHPGSRTLMGYADKRKAGFVTHKLEEYTKPDGTEASREVLKFTTAGIVRLSKILNIAPAFAGELPQGEAA